MPAQCFSYDAFSAHDKAKRFQHILQSTYLEIYLTSCDYFHPAIKTPPPLHSLPGPTPAPSHTQIKKYLAPDTRQDVPLALKALKYYSHIFNLHAAWIMYNNLMLMDFEDLLQFGNNSFKDLQSHHHFQEPVEAAIIFFRITCTCTLSYLVACCSNVQVPSSLQLLNRNQPFSWRMNGCRRRSLNLKDAIFGKWWRQPYRIDVAGKCVFTSEFPGKRWDRMNDHFG